MQVAIGEPPKANDGHRYQAPQPRDCFVAQPTDWAPRNDGALLLLGHWLYSFKFLNRVAALPFVLEIL